MDSDGDEQLSRRRLVVGGWWLVVGGWQLLVVVGCWWYLCAVALWPSFFVHCSFSSTSSVLRSAFCFLLSALCALPFPLHCDAR